MNANAPAEAGPRYLAEATTESGVTVWWRVLAFQIRLQPIVQNDESSFFCSKAIGQ